MAPLSSTSSTVVRLSIHRDIKPANLFVTRRGHSKVLDFGLAKLVASRSSTVPALADTDPGGLHASMTEADFLTSPGTAVGTIAYMSPEQVRGKDLDARSDLFSLGTVLYEMTTGILPFRGETSGVTFESILNRVPEPATRFNHSLPQKMEEILQKALEKDRELRYQSAAEIRADLKRIRRDHDSSGRSAASSLPDSPAAFASASPSSQTASFPAAASLSASANANVHATATSTAMQIASRNKLGTGLFSILALLLLAAAIYGVYSLASHKTAHAPFENFVMTRITETGKSFLAAISPDGKYVLNAQHDAQGQQSLWLRNIATNSNTQVAPASFDRYFFLTFSPDSNYLYFVRAETAEVHVSSLYRMPVLGGNVERVVHNIGPKVAFSPDGSRMAFGRYSTKTGTSEIFLASVDGSSEKSLYSGTKDLTSPTWSPDGRFLVTSSLFDGKSTATLVAIDVNSGEQKLIASSTSMLEDPVWMPDGKNLLLLSTSPETNYNVAQLALLSYPEGVLKPLTKDTSSYHTISVSSDGKTIATSQGQPVTALQLASYSAKGAAQPVTIADRPPTDSVGWTPDGKLLVSQQGSIYQMDADGSNHRALVHDNFASFDAISCDHGKYVLFGSALRAPGGGISIWRIDSAGGNLKRITDGPLDTPAMCSPDAQWLVYATLLAGKFVPMKISLANGGLPTQISDSLLTCGCINISPDGKNIAFQTQPATGGPVVIQILDFETLKPVKTLERDPRAVGEIRYVTDGSAIGYPVRDKGQYALWITPVDGSPGKQITDFATDFITDFHWNTDSSKLALIRYHSDSDVVLLRESSAPK